jgi:hypothetical protein
MMKAHVGDHVVVQARRVGGERRIGVITVVQHDDGSPPYWVRWLNDGRTTLISPGPDAHIEPAHGTPASGR